MDYGVAGWQLKNRIRIATDAVAAPILIVPDETGRSCKGLPAYAPLATSTVAKRVEQAQQSYSNYTHVPITQTSNTSHGNNLIR